MKIIKIFATAGLACAILATSAGCNIIPRKTEAPSSETATTTSESEEPTSESTTEPTTETTLETVVYEKGDELTRYNLFLRCFVEQKIEILDVNNCSLKDVVSFSMQYAKINKPEVQEYEGNYRMISLQNIQEIAGTLLNYTIKAVDLADFTPLPEEGTFDYDNEPFYKDGYFYTYAADGEIITAFAVLDNKEVLADGTYKLNFTIYELSYEKYCDLDYVNNEWFKYFSMTSAEAAADSDVTKIGSGVAIIGEGEIRPYLIKYEAVYGV